MTLAAEAPQAVTPQPELRVINSKGQLELHFHAGQLRVWDSLARFVFMMAGSQSGKTSFGPHWLDREIRRAMAAMSKVALKSEGVGDFLAVTSSYSLFQQKMLPELLKVFVEILQIGRYWSRARTIELTEGLVPNGKLWAKHDTDPMFGRIILRSADAESGLESTTAKAAWLDEVGQKEFRPSAWEAIQARLSLNQGRVLGTTTLYQYGWLKTQVYDRWRKGNADYDVVQFDSTENPRFSVAEFERLRSEMPGWKFGMRYKGRYDKPAGLVYDCFDDVNDVIPRWSVPDSWLRLVGHDFGSRNPAAVIYAQDPGTSLLYLLNSYLPGATPTADQVSWLKGKTKGNNFIRRAGGSHQEEDARENYTAHGWHVAEPAVNSVEVGIERVYALHKRGSIKVFSDNEQYLNEKSSYSYVLDDAGEATDEIENKSRFHLMDSERYVLCGLLADGAQNKGPRVVRTGVF